MTPDVPIKVILAGSPYVGKTTLLQRLMGNTFHRDRYVTTLTPTYFKKKVIYDWTRVTLNIWDTAGCERYRALSTMYFRGAQAGVVCFDLSELTTKYTFEEAKSWVRDIKDNEPECKIYLCGTKKDLVNSEIILGDPIQRVFAYAREIQSTFIQTSSITGENINQLFQTIADDYVSVPGNVQLEDTCKDTVNLQSTDRRKKSCCR